MPILRPYADIPSSFQTTCKQGIRACRAGFRGLSAIADFNNKKLRLNNFGMIIARRCEEVNLSPRGQFLQSGLFCGLVFSGC